jgi:hypothetical protein
MHGQVRGVNGTDEPGANQTEIEHGVRLSFLSQGNRSIRDQNLT